VIDDSKVCLAWVLINTWSLAGHPLNINRRRRRRGEVGQKVCHVMSWGKNYTVKGAAPPPSHNPI
jgi:hypothetical protein